MPNTIKLRRGTAAQWTAANPVLAAGEPGFETDTGKHKIGDGATAWSALDYFLPQDAVNSLYGHAPKGVEGRSYGMLLGTIRNDGSGWAPINDASHASSFIDSCSVDSSVLRVQHNLSATKVGSVIAVPDETLTAAGFSLGSSVAAAQTSISIYRSYLEYADYVYYNGSSWVSNLGFFTSLSFSAGILTLGHATLGTDAAALSASVVNRGGTYVCNVSGTGGALTQTEIKIEFRDWAGTLITTPDTNMKALVRHGRSGRVQVDPSTIDTTAYPFSNIWLFGVMER